MANRKNATKEVQTTTQAQATVKAEQTQEQTQTQQTTPEILEVQVLKVKREELKEKAQAYVDAVNNGEDDEKVLKQRKKSAMEKMDEYNTALAHVIYKAWAGADGEDPVLTAITTRYVPYAKRLVFDKNDDGTMTFSYEDATIKISLPDLQGVIGKERFTDPQWLDKCATLALLYVNKLKRETGDHGFEYDISGAIEKAFEFDEKTCGKLYSNRFFLNALQQVFDAIRTIPAEDGSNKIKVVIEEDDNGVPFSPAWTHVKTSMTKQSKTIGKTDVGTWYKMSELVCDCMHVILTNKEFGLTLFSK